ncbi:hypothetical protein KUCAC02_007211, partial [Chaenocephalus aceratus]
TTGFMEGGSFNLRSRKKGEEGEIRSWKVLKEDVGLEQWFHLHCQLAVILVLAPASAPVQQHGSSVQRGLHRLRALVREGGFSLVTQLLQRQETQGLLSGDKRKLKSGNGVMVPQKKVHEPHPTATAYCAEGLRPRFTLGPLRQPQTSKACWSFVSWKILLQTRNGYIWCVRVFGRGGRPLLEWAVVLGTKRDRGLNCRGATLRGPGEQRSYAKGKRILRVSTHTPSSPAIRSPKHPSTMNTQSVQWSLSCPTVSYGTHLVHSRTGYTKCSHECQNRGEDKQYRS